MRKFFVMVVLSTVCWATNNANAAHYPFFGSGMYDKVQTFSQVEEGKAALIRLFSNSAKPGDWNLIQGGFSLEEVKYSIAATLAPFNNGNIPTDEEAIQMIESSQAVRAPSNLASTYRIARLPGAKAEGITTWTRNPHNNGNEILLSLNGINWISLTCGNPMIPVQQTPPPGPAKEPEVYEEKKQIFQTVCNGCPQGQPSIYFLTAPAQQQQQQVIAPQPYAPPSQGSTQQSGRQDIYVHTVPNWLDVVNGVANVATAVSNVRTAFWGQNVNLRGQQSVNNYYTTPQPHNYNSGWATGWGGQTHQAGLNLGAWNGNNNIPYTGGTTSATGWTSGAMSAMPGVINTGATGSYGNGGW